MHQPGTNIAENMAYLGRISGMPKEVLGSRCWPHHLFNSFPTEIGSCPRWRQQHSFLANWSGQWRGMSPFQTGKTIPLLPCQEPPLCLFCMWAEGQCLGGRASTAPTSIWLRTTWTLSGIPFFMVFLLWLVPLAAHQSLALGKSCHFRKQGSLSKHLSGLSRTPWKRGKLMPCLAASRFVVPEGVMLINSQIKDLLGSLVSVWCFPSVFLIDKTFQIVVSWSRAEFGIGRFRPWPKDSDVHQDPAF